MSRTQGNNPIRVKKQNETLIKEIIYKYGPISRSQIAEMLSLTPPTITTNVNTLIRQGFVYETSQDEKTEEPVSSAEREKDSKSSKENRRPLGRRPVQIDFVADACYVIGAEINKYQIAVCLMDLRGNVIKSSRYIPESDEYDFIIQALLNQIEEVVENSGVDEEKILGEEWV